MQVSLKVIIPLICCSLASALDANDTCLWNDAWQSSRVNPALYNPAVMGCNTLACGYLCAQRNSSTFSAVYQGSVCFCQLNAAPSCNLASVSASDSSRPCVRTVPCLPAVAITTRASYANTATFVTVRVCCRHSNASGNVNVTVRYDSRYPTQSYSFSSPLSPCLLRNLTYAYFSPGWAVLQAKAVSGDGFEDAASELLYIKQPVGLLGAIDQVQILVGQSAPVYTQVSLAYASSLRATVDNLTLYTSSILSSQWRVVGDVERNVGVLDDSSLPALALREDATLLDVRLFANSLSDSDHPVLLVYRPQCCGPPHLHYQLAFSANNGTRLELDTPIGFGPLTHYRLADTVQLLRGDMPTVNGSATIQLVYARPVSVTFRVTYNTHSCFSKPVGCYGDDLRVLNVSSQSQHVTSAVRVLMPIANVTFSLPRACVTFLLVAMAIATHAGSLPRYVVNFGDWQGNVTVNKASRAPLSLQHLYTAANAYVTTLYTFNELSQFTAQQTVLAQDSVQGLALYAQMFPAGVNLRQATFWLTVAQGSNVSYTVHFGDQSAPAHLLLDAAPAAAPGYLQFFVVTPSADASWNSVIKETMVSGEEACAKACLTVTASADSLFCQLFAFNRQTGTCRIYQGTMEMSPFSVKWTDDSSSLYALKNSSCFYDVLQRVPNSVNVTSGSSSVRLNETGWIAANATKQAVTIAFASLLHLNVLLIKPARNSSAQVVTTFTLQSSNDTFVWLPYTNAQNVQLLNGSSVLDPPIVARYLLITVESFRGSFPSARIGLTGCTAQAISYKLTHAYNCSTTSSFAIGVTASNLVSSAAYNLSYYIDVPIGNLSMICLVSPLLVYTKSGLPIRVFGVWGNYVHMVITSQDGSLHVNSTLSYQPFFDFVVMFNDTGLWQLTVTASNYVSKAVYVLPTAVVAMARVLAGCKPPYVDVAIPNSCSPGVTCDPNYPTLDALLLFRSAQMTINSNVTSACSRMPVFDWSVSFYDASVGLYVDYLPNITAIYLKHYSNASVPVFRGHQLVSLTFKPRVFAYGLYRFQLTVTIPGTGTGIANGTYVETQEQSESSCVHVSVVQSALLPCVNNGAFTVGGILLAGGNTTLDATCSSDPDLWPDEDQRLQYAWACFRACESGPSFDRNGSFVPWSWSNPYRKCPSPNGTVVSDAGCFLPVGIHQSGPLTPRSSWDWNLDNPQNPLKLNRSFNQKYLVDNQWPYVVNREGSRLWINNNLAFFDTPLYFILTVSKAIVRSAQSMTTVRLSYLPVPNVNITCVTNCHAHAHPTATATPTGTPSPLAPRVIVDPVSSFKLGSTILNFNPATSYSYEWSVCSTNSSRNETTFDFMATLLANPSKFAVYYDWSHASTGNKSPGLAFDERFPIFQHDYYGQLMALILNVTDLQYQTTAIVYFLFIVTTPPKVDDVVMYVTPKFGYAMETQFYVLCTGGNTLTGPLSYSLGYSLTSPSNSSTSAIIEFASQCIWLTTMRRICTLDFNSVLPAGYPTNNYTVYVCVRVVDAVGSSNFSFYPAMQVLPIRQSFYDVLKNASDCALLHQMVYENSQIFLSFSYALLFTVAEQAQFNVSSTLCVENVTSTCSDTSLTNELNRIAFSSIASTIQFIPPSTTLASLSQVTTLLAYVTASSDVTLANMTSITYNTAVMLGDTLKTLASAADVNANLLEYAASQIIVALNNALNAVNKSTNRNSSHSSFSLLNDTDSLKNQTSQLIYAQLTVAETLLSKKVIDEKMIIIQNSFGVQTVTTSNLANTNIVLNPASCTEFMLGSVENLFANSLNETPAYIEFLTTQSASNPYSWQPTAANMKTTFTVDMMDEEHKLYNISNATGDSTFELWIDTELNPFNISPLSRNSTPYTLLRDSKMMIHKIDVKAWSNLFINVQQYLQGSDDVQNSSFSSSTLSDTGHNIGMGYRKNVTFIIYVQKNRKPTDNDYLANCSVPNFDVNELICSGYESNITITAAALNNMYEELQHQTDSNFYHLLTQIPNRCTRYSRKLRSPWTCMLTPEQLTNFNDTTYYLGVRAIARNWSLPYAANDTTYSRVSNQNGTGDLLYLEVNYTLFTYFSGCYFYDATLDVFSTAGCTVGKCSSPFATQCYCTHLTSFSNMFSLPPISFDISSLNVNALNQSPGVMCFLVAIICAYCVVWLWARHSDLKEEEKLCVVYLPDNDSRDCFAYEVTIWTGHLPGSGTSANVSITLVGDSGETGPRLVSTLDRCNSNSSLKTGSVDVFLLTNAVWLGKMSHIRVWHDNSGKSPSWYLLRILVRDIFANKKYYFTYNSWLSLYHGHGKIDTVIPVAGERELREFGNVFWSRATNHLLNGHLWLSVVTSSTRSRFTRVQRLTCCLVVCMTSVLFNLFGHIVRLNASQLAKLSPENLDPSIVTLGPIKITAFTFIISFISAACTLPVNTLIVLLFQQRGLRKFSALAKGKNQYSPYEVCTPETKDKSEDALSVVTAVKSDEEEEEAISCLDRISTFITAYLRKLLPFPWWSSYIAYTLALMSVFTSFLCSAVLAYSNLPQAWQQDDWLSSIVLTLTQTIFVVQPLQIALTIMIFALILKLPYEDRDERSEEISARRPLVEIPTSAAVRRNLRTTSSVKPPPSGILMQILRAKRLEERKMLSQVVALFFYSILIAILLVTVNKMVPSSRFYQFELTSSQLRPRNVLGSNSLLSIKQCWLYIGNTVLPFIHSDEKYNFDIIKKSVLPLPVNWSNNYTFVATKILLGARLRQQRVIKSDCLAPDLTFAVISDCDGHRSTQTLDTNNYLPGWAPLPVGADSNISTLTPYTYSQSSDALAFGETNRLGYSASLGTSLSSSVSIVEYLSSTAWIDLHTSVVYVEFLVFDTSTNVYTVGFSELQLGPTEITYQPQFYTLWLDNYDDSSGKLRILLEIICGVALLIFVVDTFISLCKKNSSAKIDGWLVFDIIISCFSVLLIALFGLQFIVSLHALSLIREEPKQFVNLKIVCCLNAVTVWCFGFLVFLAIIRLTKFYHFYRRSRIIVYSFASTGSEWRAALIHSFIFLLTVSQVALLVQSNTPLSFGKLTMFSWMKLNSIGYSKNSMKIRENSETWLFIFCFLLPLVVTMRCCCAILLSAFRAARSNKRNMEETKVVNPLDYWMDKIKRLLFVLDKNYCDESDFACISTGEYDLDDICFSLEQKVEELGKKMKTIINSIATPVNNLHSSAESDIV